MNLIIGFINNEKLLKALTYLIFVITFFILFIFEPFGDIQHGYTLKGILRVVSYALTASLTFYISERFVKTFLFNTHSDQSHKMFPLYWYFLELFIITIGIFLAKSYWMDFKNVSLNSFLLVLYRVFVIAIIPYTILIIIVYKSKKVSEDDVKITFKSKDKNPDYLKLKIDQILLLQSEENYTSIFYLDNEILKHQLMRGSLSFFEEQVKMPLLRVHRSHIINMSAVKKVEYNSQGGKVLLYHINSDIRISRKYVQIFKNTWVHLQPN